MIKSLTYLLLFPLLFISCTNKEAEIKFVVNKWNEIHNTHNAIELKDLYTPEVKFYGRQTPMETCYARKTILLTSDFHQDIVSPINISYYSNGIIKCDFTKRTMYGKDKLREYFCYLLLKREAGKYLITGESDSQSDQNRHVQLELGNKIASPANRTKLYIGLIILLIVILAAIWAIVKWKRKLTEWELFKERYKAPNVTDNSIMTSPSVSVLKDEDFAIKVKEIVNEQLKKQSSVDSPQQKGLLFENYIVERFKEPTFKLHEWRSDKIHQGIYPLSNTLPDLKYSFTTSRHNFFIAIECKWRANFKNGSIQIARQDQLQNYWKYHIDNQIEVFIILGIGGKPDDPEDIYIIPLDKISGVELSKANLEIFKQYNKNNYFFLDGNTMEFQK